MRVTFDSNSWEKVFGSGFQTWRPIHDALSTGRISGFICEAAFRIEAIQKKERPSYFAKPKMDAKFSIRGRLRQDKPEFGLFSLGPDDAAHPGLPEVQVEKLQRAFSAGVRLLRGNSWLGLPSPPQIQDPALFDLDEEGRSKREVTQMTIMKQISARGVGMARFEAAGGWDAVQLKTNKKFERACAEWADAELVAAHIAYRNDLLCTDDHAVKAGGSIFDAANRDWLVREHHVRFVGLAELAKEIDQ